MQISNSNCLSTDEKNREKFAKISALLISLWQFSRQKLSSHSAANHFLLVTFPVWIYFPIISSNLSYNCSNLLDNINLQEKVKKAFCYHNWFWPCIVWINCSSDLKKFANSRPSTSNFKSFSQSLEKIFLTVGQNNFGNRIP